MTAEWPPGIARWPPRDSTSARWLVLIVRSRRALDPGDPLVLSLLVVLAGQSHVLARLHVLEAPGGRVEDGDRDAGARFILEVDRRPLDVDGEVSPLHVARHI